MDLESFTNKKRSLLDITMIANIMFQRSFRNIILTYKVNFYNSSKVNETDAMIWHLQSSLNDDLFELDSNTSLEIFRVNFLNNFKAFCN